MSSSSRRRLPKLPNRKVLVSAPSSEQKRGLPKAKRRPNRGVHEHAHADNQLVLGCRYVTANVTSISNKPRI